MNEEYSLLSAPVAAIIQITLLLASSSSAYNPFRYIYSVASDRMKFVIPFLTGLYRDLIFCLLDTNQMRLASAPLKLVHLSQL